MNLRDELADCLALQDALNAEPPQRAVRGGNSGFMDEHGRAISEDSGSCLRVILLRSKGVQGPVSLQSRLTFNLGLAFEKTFEALALSGKFALQSQVPMTAPIGDTGVPFRGTADFVLTEPDGTRTVVDTKGVSALRSFHSTFVSRKIKLNYLAQLVTYMDVLGTNRGALVPAAFLYVPKDYLTAGKQRDLGMDKGLKVQPDVTQLDVRLEGARIHVDGQLQPYTLGDARRHRTAAAKVIADDAVAERPHRPEGGFHPCGLCAFRSACDKFDGAPGATTEAFVSLAKQSVGG